MSDKVQMSDKVRNIGIIAHIDAGKTTTTERILYYTGVNFKMGEVHDGNTTTDWMKQERERGITIVSAAVTCTWNDNQINLIDTPGHIDFSVEVDRSLRVLDGVVIVLCAVSGVEPQTENVWLKSEEYRIPKIVYINKMDRQGADFFSVIDDIGEKFEDNAAVVITLPILKDTELIGYVDVVNGKVYMYQYDIDASNYSELLQTNEFTIEDALSKNIISLELYNSCKFMYFPMLCSTILSKLGEENNSDLNFISSIVNDQIKYEDIYGENRKQTADIIKRSLRTCVVNHGVVPIMCGSSLKNKGINVVLDSVIDYLPNPLEAKNKEIRDSKGNEILGREDEPVSALVFKTMNDKYVGSMAATRIYSGTIHTGDILYNPLTKKRERIARIIRMHSDKRKDIDTGVAGDIVGIIGLKETATGHTLCSEDNPIILEQIHFSEPVVSASIKVESKNDYEKLSFALKKLTFEDPSFSYRIDRETKETLISGMGGLHLEIMASRMEEEFGVKVTLGTPQVCYREAITQSAHLVEGKYIKQSGGRGQYGHIIINMEPSEERLEFVDKIVGGAISESYKTSIKKALEDIIETGVIANYPIFGVKITLINGSEHEVDSSDIAFKIATEIAFKEAFNKCKPILLEPIAKVVIVTPDENLGDVTSNISAKRGIIENIKEKGSIRILTALIPRSNLFSYASDLRSISSGRAFHTSMEHYGFKPMPSHIESEIIALRKNK